MIFSPFAFRYSFLGLIMLWAASGCPIPAMLTDEYYEGGPVFVQMWPGLLGTFEEGWSHAGEPEAIGESDLASESDYEYDNGE